MDIIVLLLAICLFLPEIIGVMVFLITLAYSGEFIGAIGAAIISWLIIKICINITRK
jgi:hypothetical protein